MTRFRTQSDSRGLLYAWGCILLVSSLPDILFQELTGSVPGWLFAFKLLVIGIFLIASFFWRVAAALRRMFVALAVLYLASLAITNLEATPGWQSLFATDAFVSHMFGIQISRLAIALLVIASLVAQKLTRRDLYLVKGDLSATGRKVSWLGIDEGTRWSFLGPISALLIGLGTLAFIIAGGLPSADALTRLLSLLPAVFLFAAFNAFSEEAIYRSAFLGSLEPVLGPKQALLISAAFFGIGHYFGVPYGLLGGAMAGLLGWFMGKAMQETKGFFWTWVIHFWQDVIIFSMIAIGFISA